MQSVLMVEDNEDSIRLMLACLKGLALFTVAKSVLEAKLLINSMSFDLILLDVNLPDGCGLALCAEMQASEFLRHIPVIITSCYNETEYKVKAFSIGVDDYLTKPLDIQVFRARIESKLLKIQDQNKTLLKIGQIKIDTLMQRVHVGNETIDLTAGEFKVLMFLATNAGSVLDREAISDKVWGEQSETSMRQVDARISRLRKKIGQDKIESVHGVGYRLVA